MVTESWKLIYSNVTLKDKKNVYMQDRNIILAPMEKLAVYGGERKQQVPILFLLGGYVNPTNGRVYQELGNKKTPLLPEVVGMGPIPPFTPFFSSLRVEESIVQQGKLFRVSHATSRAKELIQQWDLESVRKERLKDIKEEWVRRAEIAMALVHHPKLLLLHVPEQSLENGTWKQIWEHLIQIQAKEGFAIALTTYDLETASQCPHIINLQEES